MLKKAVQLGRSKRRGEAYASVRRASERSENEAGRLFQHPAKPAGGTVPIRRDMIEHGGTHEERLCLTCHPKRNRLLLK
jgi:hypothetical protein